MRWPLVPFAWFCAEVLLLVKVGEWIGALQTLALVLFSMAMGALLLRAEGLVFVARMARIFQHQAASRAANRDETDLDRQVPARPLAESAPRFLAGLLFIVPGFLSDLVGLLFLLPPLRGRLTRRVQAFIEESRHTAISRRRFTTFDIDSETGKDEAGDADEEDRHPRIGRRIP